MKHKKLSLDVKAVTDDGTFEVYAAVFGNVDRQGETCAPNCFTNLEAFTTDGWADVNHEWDALGFGTIDSAVQDSVGLKITGRFHSTPDAQALRTKVAERIARGKSVKCSIGYRVIAGGSEMIDGKSVFVIKQAELYEFSFVNLPANPLAGVLTVKSYTDDLDRAYAALRVGGSVSATDRERLSKCAARLREAASDLTAWLAGSDDNTEARRLALKRRSLKMRSRQSVLV